MTIADINEQPRRPRPIIRPFVKLDIVDKAAEIHRRTRLGQTVAEIAAACGVTPGSIAETARSEGISVLSDQSSNLWPKKNDPGFRGRRPAVVVLKPPVKAAAVAQSIAPPPPVNMLDRPGGRFIIQLVSMKHRIPVDDIVGPRRERRLVDARHEAIRLVRDHCPHMSLPMIGRLFGGRDHSTIMHSLARTAARP